MRLRCLGALFLTLFVGISLHTIYVFESHEKEGRTAEIVTLRDFKVQRNSSRVGASTRRHLAFDEACPPLYEPVTPVLSSIPKNLTSNTTTSEPLFTYNPTIHKYHGSEGATYIASFRVGTYPWLQKDYLGLALMDSRLEILKSVVLDINLYATMQYAAKKRHANEPPLFSDYRLVWYNGTYFVTNSIAILVLSIGDDTKPNNTPIPVMFDGGLSVRAASPVRKIRRVTKGRNFNFYTTQQQLLLEEWPLPTPRYVGTGRKVLSIRIFDDWRFDALESWESTEAAPEPSFQGPDAAFDRTSGNICDDRGTVCCVKLEKEYYQDLAAPAMEDDYLLIGISHVKSFKRIRMSHGEKYAYLSRFYAVRPTIPPTDIVAQSGLFCWTGGVDDERMEWNGVVYDCPVIQFPSGMTESATNSSVLLVAYGINDVTSRIVQIKKRDVATWLFASLAEV